MPTGKRGVAARRDASIGVFDSGVGGLTVLRELRRAMPHERILYFGDTARLPYGSKSKEAVTRFSLQNARFLCRRRVKLLVVACNSASALALPTLQEKLGVPVVGVIDPAVRAAVEASRNGIIGVIGTEATIASQAYQQALSRLGKGLKTLSAACPLLVPLVEEGWWEHPVTRAVAGHYLKPLLRGGMDALILGCTHYPLIEPVLRSLAGRKVRLIDSGVETACEVRRLLVSGRLDRRSGAPSQEFFVSDAPERFRRLARRILGPRGIRVRLAAVD